MSQEKQVDLKTLANTLSQSYSAILQYNLLNKQQITEHVHQLSTYSNQLPLSWFSSALINSLLNLEKQFEIERDYQNESYIFNLFSIWAMRLSNTKANNKDNKDNKDIDLNEKEQLLPSILTLFSKRLLSLDPKEISTLSIRKNAWMGLVAMIGGHGPSQFDEEKILSSMTNIILFYSKQQNDDNNNNNMTMNNKEQMDSFMIESLNAGVAHSLAESTRLNVFEMESCQHLLEALIQLDSKYQNGPMTICTLLEHAVDVRSRLTPQTRAEADLSTLFSIVENILEKLDKVDDTFSLSLYFTNLGIIAGVVRMLQFNQGAKSKKVDEIQKKAQSLFIKHFNVALTNVISNHQDSLYTHNCELITYFSGQCLPNLPTELVKTIDLKVLLQTLVSCLLTSKNTWNNGMFIGQLENADDLIKLQSNPVYKEIGRISRSLGKVIQVMLEEKVEGASDVVQLAIDRLEGLSYNVYIDWDNYVIQHANNNMKDKKIQQEIDSNIWAIFKTFIFAYTAILKAVAVDVLSGQGLIDVPNAAQSILSIYGNLNFINERLGSANGFQAYQETLTNSVAYLKHEENSCQLNKLISLAFREYGINKFTTDQTPLTSMLSTVQRSRLLFFVNLIEQVMKPLKDNVLEEDVLPVIYPIVKWKTILDKDLFESSHAAILSIFSSQKEISRELAGVYANLLINNFPKPLTHHQIRLAYVTMVQSLCEMDDSVAWLTVQHVLEKINQLNQEGGDENIVLRSQYVILFIDLLKPLSLGPYFGKALHITEKLIKQQETKTMQQSTLKILFETVSGPGISDMRKVEAVGWYLELKRQLSL
ncbi:unnamed protein product [Cunninghamella blakesleeana]